MASVVAAEAPEVNGAGPSAMAEVGGAGAGALAAGGGGATAAAGGGAMASDVGGCVRTPRGDRFGAEEKSERRRNAVTCRRRSTFSWRRSADARAVRRAVAAEAGREVSRGKRRRSEWSCLLRDLFLGGLAAGCGSERVRRTTGAVPSAPYSCSYTVVTAEASSTPASMTASSTELPEACSESEASGGVVFKLRATTAVAASARLSKCSTLSTRTDELPSILPSWRRIREPSGVSERRPCP
mmetsp:Transcript_36257/g.116752  ORF Transcript_36257/g.116752 Transcript_36257/m.116752 type:complete len:241 (-) Transcript_36257:166-888(-)